MYFVKKNEDSRNSFFNDFSNFFNTGFFSKDMKTDIIETNNQYELLMEIPGVNKDEISINYEDSTLTVSIVRNKENEDKKNYICKERSFSNVSRSYYLENGDEENIKAKLSNGILIVTVGKTEKIETKKTISID